MSFLTDLSQAKSQCTMLCVNFYSFCYNTSTPTWLEPTFPTLFPTILQQELHTPDKLFPEHALCIPACILHTGSTAYLEGHSTSPPIWISSV